MNIKQVLFVLIIVSGNTQGAKEVLLCEKHFQQIDEQALNFCLDAAYQGYLLGVLSAGEILVSQNEQATDPQGMELILLAANEGYPRAQSMIGYINYAGILVKMSFSEAAKWLGKAFDNGDYIFADIYAKLHRHGLGVERDLKKAEDILLTVFNSGDPAVAFDLAAHYYFFDKPLSRKYAEIAKKYGDLQGYYILSILLAPNNLELAEEILILSARKGSARSRYALASHYSGAAGTSEKSFAKAYAWAILLKEDLCEGDQNISKEDRIEYSNLLWKIKIHFARTDSQAGEEYYKSELSSYRVGCYQNVAQKLEISDDDPHRLMKVSKRKLRGKLDAILNANEQPKQLGTP